ncbi:MAG: hypothetical protein V1709_10715 [Planctomycetota bacterium]
MSIDVFESVKLTRLPKLTRLFVTMFLMMMTLGYLLAIVNVNSSLGGMSYDNIIRYYLGSKEYPETYPGMDFNCLISFSHTHVIATGLMLFCLGLIFQFTGTLPLWLKKIVLVGSFAALFVTEGSFWLIKYVTPLGAYLLILSGVFLGICIFFEIVIPLYEMWIKKETQAN